MGLDYVLAAPLGAEFKIAAVFFVSDPPLHSIARPNSVDRKRPLCRHRRGGRQSGDLRGRPPQL